MESQVLGYQISNDQTLTQMCDPDAAYACTPGIVGAPIVLSAAYYVLTSAGQNAVILHEMLHSVTGLSDVGVTQALGITIPAGQTASQAINNWLLNDCQNP